MLLPLNIDLKDVRALAELDKTFFEKIDRLRTLGIQNIDTPDSDEATSLHGEISSELQKLKIPPIVFLDQNPQLLVSRMEDETDTGKFTYALLMSRPESSSTDTLKETRYFQVFLPVREATEYYLRNGWEAFKRNFCQSG